MPELSFDVLDARPDVYGTDPTILFKLRIAETSGDPIHTMMVRVQIQIDAQLRRYDDGERARLAELFGEPERWGETLRPFNWTHAATMLQGFRGLDGDRARRAVHVRLRHRRRQVPARPARRRTSRSASCSAARSSRAGRPATP